MSVHTTQSMYNIKTASKTHTYCEALLASLSSRTQTTIVQFFTKCYAVHIHGLSEA